MKADCPICAERLGEGELSACPCGHVFHKQCIQRWLTVKQNCPQCRIKVSFSSLVQLYFDTTVDTSQLVVLEESDAEIKKELKESQKNVKELQAEKAKLSDDLHLLEISLSQHIIEKEELKEGLQKEKTSNLSMKNQLKLMTRCKHEAEVATKEVEHLQQQMTLYKNIYRLLSDENANDEDVDDMTSNATNADLKSFVKVLNRELTSKRKKHKEYRNKIQDHQRAVHRYKTELMQEREACKKLKELNMYLEEEVKKLEEENRRLKANLNDEPVVKRARFTATPVIDITSPVSNASDTAYSAAKVNGNKKLSTALPLANFNILKPRLKTVENSAIRQGYNGLGGQDRFLMTKGVGKSIVGRNSSKKLAGMPALPDMSDWVILDEEDSDN